MTESLTSLVKGIFNFTETFPQTIVYFFSNHFFSAGNSRIIRATNSVKAKRQEDQKANHHGAFKTRTGRNLNDKLFLTDKKQSESSSFIVLPILLTTAWKRKFMGVQNIWSLYLRGGGLYKEIWQDIFVSIYRGGFTRREVVCAQKYGKKQASRQ